MRRWVLALIGLGLFGNDAGGARRYQLSIRQFFAITTTIAVDLGLVRVLVQPLLGMNIVQLQVEPIFNLFLVGLASVLSQVPNWLALLLPRRWPVRAHGDAGNEREATRICQGRKQTSRRELQV